MWYSHEIHVQAHFKLGRGSQGSSAVEGRGLQPTCMQLSAMFLIPLNIFAKSRDQI